MKVDEYRNTRKLAEFCARKGLRLPPEASALISDSHIVTIFDESGAQIFKSYGSFLTLVERRLSDSDWLPLSQKERFVDKKLQQARRLLSVFGRGILQDLHDPFLIRYVSIGTGMFFDLLYFNAFAALLPKRQSTKTFTLFVCEARFTVCTSQSELDYFKKKCNQFGVTMGEVAPLYSSSDVSKFFVKLSVPRRYRKKKVTSKPQNAYPKTDILDEIRKTSEGFGLE